MTSKEGRGDGAAYGRALVRMLRGCLEFGTNNDGQAVFMPASFAEEAGRHTRLKRGFGEVAESAEQRASLAWLKASGAGADHLGGEALGPGDLVAPVKVARELERQLMLGLALGGCVVIWDGILRAALTGRGGRMLIGPLTRAVNAIVRLERLLETGGAVILPDPMTWSRRLRRGLEARPRPPTPIELGFLRCRALAAEGMLVHPYAEGIERQKVPGVPLTLTSVSVSGFHIPERSHPVDFHTAQTEAREAGEGGGFAVWSRAAEVSTMATHALEGEGAGSAFDVEILPLPAGQGRRLLVALYRAQSAKR